MKRKRPRRKRPRSAVEHAAGSTKYSSWNGPRYIRDRGSRTLLLTIGLFTLFFASILGGVMAQESGYPQVLPLAGGVTIVLVVLITTKLALSATSYVRLIRRARAAGFQLCQHCLYDLTHAETGGGICPECGKDYDIHDTRRRWRIAFCAYAYQRLNARPSGSGG